MACPGGSCGPAPGCPWPRVWFPGAPRLLRASPRFLMHEWCKGSVSCFGCGCWPLERGRHPCDAGRVSLLPPSPVHPTKGCRAVGCSRCQTLSAEPLPWGQFWVSAVHRCVLAAVGARVGARLGPRPTDLGRGCLPCGRLWVHWDAGREVTLSLLGRQWWHHAAGDGGWPATPQEARYGPLRAQSAAGESGTSGG